MIVKRNFNPLKVIQYVKTELLYAVTIAVTVFFLHMQGVTAISFPFSIAAILGSALAIFIAFRNNSSYSRWWEARTLWGGIINSSRVLARLIITFTDSHAHQQNYDKEKSELFKKEMIYKVIAWVHALRLHLRKQNNWQELKPFLSEQEFTDLQNSQTKPNFIHLISGKKIYEALNQHFCRTAVTNWRSVHRVVKVKSVLSFAVRIMLLCWL